MTENNYLCIMAFDKLAVWGGTNIKHTSNAYAQCSLTLLENFSEAREEGKRSCSKLGETSTEEDAPHCYLASLKGWKLEGNNKYSVGFIYKRPQKGFFLLYDAHANQSPALTFSHITLHCSHFKPFLAVQFLYLLLHSIWFISCGANILSKALKKEQRIWEWRHGQVQWLMAVQFRIQGKKVFRDSCLQHRCIWIY